MNDLSPNARQVLDEALAAEAPKASDRDRVRAALVVTIGAGAFAGTLGAASAASALTGGAAASAAGAGGVATGSSLGLATKLAATIMLVGAVGTTATVSYQASFAPGERERMGAQDRARAAAATAERRRAQPRVGPPPPVVAEALPAVPIVPLENAPRPLAHRPLVTPDPPLPPVVPVAPAPPPVDPESTLSPERAVLERAMVAARAGQYAVALSFLDEHNRRFPNGVLREEALAQRIAAFCQMGRIDQGRRMAEAFLRDHPRSGHAPAVRRACASVLVQP